MACYPSGLFSRVHFAAAAILLAVASSPARPAKLVPASPAPRAPESQLESQQPPSSPARGRRPPRGPRRAPPRPREALRWIVASRGEDLEVVDIADVRFFKSDNKYTRVAMGDRDLLIRKTIRELAESLDPDLFWQVHRAVIVNVRMVKSVTHGTDGKLVVRVKDRREELHVSQAYARRFHRM